MIDILSDAIKVLTSLVHVDMKADDALKYTQAALNLAHVVATFDYANKNK